jgi:hypothetical protein
MFKYPMITVKDELPPNPNPDVIPDEVYQAFAGLTLPVVTPFGDYALFCPFLGMEEQTEAEGVMCSGDMLVLALEERSPAAARWFRQNKPVFASGTYEDERGSRPFMMVFPYDIEVPGVGTIAHEKAIHTKDRLRAS